MKGLVLSSSITTHECGPLEVTEVIEQSDTLYN